jgi:integrase
MPIKLVPPREGTSKNWRIRGTYLRERVDQTTGTPDRKLAAKILSKVREDIERGAFSRPGAPTFTDAALNYCQAGGERRFVLRLADHFGETPLTRIDQAAVDAAALALYPRATPATRNRQVYSPVSAILKAAGVPDGLKRPKGARGARRLFWLTPEQASALLTAAEARDAEFGLFLAFLLYTGCRLTEALSLQIAGVNLSEGWARVLETKNGEPRLVHLPPVIVAALATHPRGLARVGKVFRFGKNGRLYTWLDDAARAAGVEIPQGVAFHAFRHTWGAWMRRYGGLDTTGLVETGAWRSRQAAAVYEHAEQSAEARKADLLPNVWRGGDSRNDAQPPL